VNFTQALKNELEGTDVTVQVARRGGLVSDYEAVQASHFLCHLGEDGSLLHTARSHQAFALDAKRLLFHCVFRENR